jgi:hypothetical protein
MGEEFLIVPEFSLTEEQGEEWEKAAGATNELLSYQKNTSVSKLPVVDDWLYGIARVREKMRHFENVIMLTGAFGKAEPGLDPIQLPYKKDDHWLALSFPEDYEIDSDRLLYTAHYAVPFAKGNAQCGLLLDEWTEVIPAKDETTGITFNYDRPNSEPPQVMLLVTPPDFRGSWQWVDLVDALHETLDMAKQRAIEPKQIDSSAFATFLPAVLMAATPFGRMAISTDLAANNDLYNYLGESEDD